MRQAFSDGVQNACKASERYRGPRLRPVRSARGLQIVCGDKSGAKAIRKRLERKQGDIVDAIAALRTLPPTASPATAAYMVAHIQRLGLETGALLQEAAICLEEMDAEAAAQERQAAAESAASEAMALATSHTNDKSTELQDTANLPVDEALALSAIETPSEVHIAPEEEVMPGPSQAEDVRLEQVSTSEGSTSALAPPLLSAVAIRFPKIGRLWNEARNALGFSNSATVTVCQGKSCNRAGGSEVLQVVEGIAGEHSGIEVETCKCLDRCKQGPCLQIETEAGTTTCVSMDKPPKKAKKEKLGNNIVSTGGLSRDASLIS